MYSDIQENLKILLLNKKNESEDQKLIPDVHPVDSSTESDEESDVAENVETKSNNGSQVANANFDEYIPKSKRKALFRASAYLFFGTLIVILFADPMVKSIGALGASLNLSPFYIAFVITPAASNSSELFSAYAFAKKKTKKTTSLIHSALYGAVAMNNTISLGVFLQ